MLNNFEIYFLSLSLLSLLFVFLSINIIKHRVKEQALIGSKGVPNLKAAIRSQANFSEYVPITMLVFYGLVYFEINNILFMILNILLVLARVFHSLSILKYEKSTPPYIRFRQMGIFTNFILIIFAVVYIIFSIII